MPGLLIGTNFNLHSIFNFRMLAARREVKINSIINTIFNLIFLFPLPVLCKTFSDLPRLFFYLIIQLTCSSSKIGNSIQNLFGKNLICHVVYTVLLIILICTDHLKITIISQVIKPL